MKIGILTFQHSINFGAQLQCFALQQILHQEGHLVEIINYTPASSRNSSVIRGIGLKKNGIIKALYFLLIKTYYGKKMKKRFDQFQLKHFTKTPICNETSIAKVTKHFDAIIVGSDQVWGPANHSTAINFIGWSPEYQGKRISYAPCCAINRVDDKHKKRLQSLLKQFHAISVRNLETFSFVKTLINIKAPIVLDPTFLYPFEEFKKSFKPPYKKYIFVYVIGNEITGSHKQLIAEIKKSRGEMPVIVAQLSEKHPQLFSWADKTYYSLTPDEWLSLIAQADFFYTDSFHGAVFALKFNINFVAYYVEEKRKSRFVDLSERFFLDKNIITSVDDAIKRGCIQADPADFNKTHLFLNKEVILSQKYLFNSLG
jgi:polysaccharide pyruvyl transferase WcaK-like protein